MSEHPALSEDDVKMIESQRTPQWFSGPPVDLTQTEWLACWTS